MTLSSRLAPFAPVPFVVRDDDGLRLVEHAQASKSFGRMSAFHGQMGMFVRAQFHSFSWRGRAAAGVRRRGLSANYVRVLLNDVMSAPFGDRPCMHEALFDDRWLKETGLTTLDFAEGNDRRRLSSDDSLFSADRARRHADRADRVRIEGEPRLVHYDPARSCVCSEGRRSGTLSVGPGPRSAPPPRRDARGAPANPSLDEACADENRP